MEDAKENFYKLHGVTSPDELAEIISELPDIPDIDLSEYGFAIRHLHDEKGYSFKRIVEFLAEHGLQTNRSAVYRVYKTAMDAVAEEPDPLIDPETGEVVED